MKSEITQIKKFKIWSVGKVFLVIGLILGIFQGISLGFAAQQTLAASPEIATMSFTDSQVAGNAQAIFGLAIIKLGYWSILVMPLVMAITYFIGGVILALIYNLVARYTGGIKLVLN